MAVTSRELNRRRWQPTFVVSYQLHRLTYLGTALLVLVALYVLLTFLVGWGQARFDDVRYGMPRTYHLTADVGHSAETGQPSHLIALNLDRQVVVLDMPGGDINKVRVLTGPYLFGADEHLTPVTLRLQDFDGNRAPDLVVKVKDEELIYMNHDGSFAPITPAERQHLQLLGGES